MTTILKLTRGDAVRDHRGIIGAVRGFCRDGVSIEWGADDVRWYSDADLKAAGVVKVTPADALRPVKR